MTDQIYTIFNSVLIFVVVFLLIHDGYGYLLSIIARQRRWYHKVLVHELLIDVDPKHAVLLAWLVIGLTGVMLTMIVGGPQWFIVGCLIGACLPYLVIRHLEQKRRERLDEQIVDGITTLSSGVRAGLNLVQSMQLLVQNTIAPIQQEFAQLHREYEMGLDLNAAMRKASNRIESTHYRLLFTALEMHRVRGGDAGETLDRLAESIREIQRLEGKLDAITSQSRMQAWMLGAAPLVIMLILYIIDPESTSLLFTDPIGRIILLGVFALIIVAFVWIRRIMAVDI